MVWSKCWSSTPSSGLRRTERFWDPTLKIIYAIAISFVAATPLLGAQESESASITKPVIVQMSYFAKPGSESDVLRLRLRAAELLSSLGLTRGRVWRATESPRATKEPVGATVIWQGEFADESKLAAYEKVADNHPDFLAIRKAMANFTVRAERRYFREAK